MENLKPFLVGDTILKTTKTKLNWGHFCCLFIKLRSFYSNEHRTLEGKQKVVGARDLLP